jgi:hypothetical protein
MHDVPQLLAKLLSGAPRQPLVEEEGDQAMLGVDIGTNRSSRRDAANRSTSATSAGSSSG